MFVGVKYSYFKAFNQISGTGKRLDRTKIKLHLDREQSIKITEKARKKRSQVVDSQQSDRNLEDKNTRFLSERNQSVDKETIASKVDPFKVAGRGTENGSVHISPLKKQNSHKKQHFSHQKGRSKKKRELALSDLSTPSDGSSYKPPKGRLTGENDSIGEASSNDYIDDVPLGDMTKLNTREFKYYGFYYRIKQSLEQYWGYEVRKKVEKLLRRGKRPFNTESMTFLSISINKKGQIVDVIIKSASGFREFDEAAIESFNKAGPFPNPPEGMLKNGIARIEWGFVVKT